MHKFIYLVKDKNLFKFKLYRILLFYFIKYFFIKKYKKNLHNYRTNLTICKSSTCSTIAITCMSVKFCLYFNKDFLI